MSYILIDTVEKLDTFLENTTKLPAVIYADIETTGLDYFVDEILLFQVMIGKDIYILDVRELGYAFLTGMIRWIGNNSRAVFHNTKFDLKFIYHRTGFLLENVYDTMTAEAVLLSGSGKQYFSLEELAEKYSDTFMDKEVRKEFINYPKDQPFTEKQLNYSALDVKVLEHIYLAQIKQFEETNQNKVIELESNLIPIVAKMEYDGITLNRDEWIKLDRVARQHLEELNDKLIPEIADYAINKFKVNNGLELVSRLKISEGTKTKRDRLALESITDLPLMKRWICEHINLGSWQQKVAILNMYGVRVTSSNEKIIQKHAAKFPIVSKLLEISGVEKQISQYGESFLKDIHPFTGRVHTEYSTVGTQTGRFSSSRPNLQNVPTDGGYRECFIPRPGYVFISCDYSQQEYRLAGAVSGDPIIIEAYLKGYDMHTATAANFNNKDLKDVTKEERKWGKTRNFEIIYGTTEYGLSKSLKCSIAEALEKLKMYWKGYPRLYKFKEMAEKKIMELGYSVTPLGRRRYNLVKPLLGNSNDYLFWEARVKREGFNHIIQGGGADIIKISMVNLFRNNPFGDKFRILLQIHDELLFEIHESVAKEAGEFIKMEMVNAEQPFLGTIPAVVEGYDIVKERWSK
jgi:DNA polymerase I-like protein with 3'-5' exonuclease and polymerase domains